MKKFQIFIFKILYIKCPKCPGTSAFMSQSLALGCPNPRMGLFRPNPNTGCTSLVSLIKINKMKLSFHAITKFS